MIAVTMYRKEQKMQVIGKIGFRYATEFDRLPDEVIGVIRS